MPPNRLRLSAQERLSRAEERIGAGSAGGRVESASPVRREKLSGGRVQNPGATGSSSYNDGDGINVTVSTATDLPWIEDTGNPQAGLLDLTDPYNPTVVADGIYAVTISAIIAAVGGNTNTTPTGSLELRFQDALNFIILTQAGYLAFPGHVPIYDVGQPSVSGTFFVQAGGTIKAKVTHDYSNDATCYLIASVQKLS